MKNNKKVLQGVSGGIRAAAPCLFTAIWFSKKLSQLLSGLQEVAGTGKQKDVFSQTGRFAIEPDRVSLYNKAVKEPDSEIAQGI